MAHPPHPTVKMARDSTQKSQNQHNRRQRLLPASSRSPSNGSLLQHLNQRVMLFVEFIKPLVNIDDTGYKATGWADNRKPIFLATSAASTNSRFGNAIMQTHPTSTAHSLYLLYETLPVETQQQFLLVLPFTNIYDNLFQ